MNLFLSLSLLFFRNIYPCLTNGFVKSFCLAVKSERLSSFKFETGRGREAEKGLINGALSCKYECKYAGKFEKVVNMKDCK